MSLFSRLRSFFRSTLRRSRMEREMDAELQFHLAARIDDLVARGVPPGEAARRARAEFGDPIKWKEGARDARGLRILDDIGTDVRYGIRLIRRSPVFAAIAVLSMGLGIGVNTAVFSLLNDALLKRLPVQDPESLVLLALADGTRDVGETFPYPFCQQLSAATDVLGGAACVADMGPSVQAGPQAELASGELVSGNYFELLGIRPHLGRLLTSEDDRQPGDHPVVVLSYGYWQRRFGGDPGVIGRAIRINTHPMAVVGVTPRGFYGTEYGHSVDIRVPMSMQAEMHAAPLRLRQTTDWWVRIVARVKDGLTRAQAAEQLQGRYAAYVAAVDAKGAPSRLLVRDGSRGGSSPRERRVGPLLILTVLVAIVLLLVCVNVANLMLSRASARQQELSVRLALGAGRGRIVRQLLVESLVLAAAGGALGFLVSWWAANTLLAMAGDASLDLPIDRRVFTFSAAISTLTGLLCGLPQAWTAGRTSLSSAIKTGSRELAGHRTAGRALLVAAQVAVSLLLLVGAGLFVRTLSNLRSAPFGFDSGRLLVVTMNPAFSGYTRERAGLFFEQMTERVASLPGVESAALAVMPLLGGSEWGGALTLDNGRRHEPGPMRDAVGPGYFRTVGIPLAEGREFTDADRPGAPPVAIVNESFVRAYLDGGPALGRRIAMGVPAGFPGFTIVGVARDGKHARVRQESVPFWYMPRLQLSPGWNLTAQTLHVRTTGDPTSMIGSVRQTIAAIDSSVTVLGAYTMTDQIEDHLEVERLLATLGLVFGIVAALLASLGLYGVVAYAITARTREIGVRMALGAESAQILGLFLRQTVRIVACGLIAGLILVAFTVGYLRSVLYGVEPLDWFSVGSAAVVVVVVTGVAAFVPAHRATRINPVTALQ